MNAYNGSPSFLEDDSFACAVLSPMKKRRLCVEESSEFENVEITVTERSKIAIAKTERKVCCPEDLRLRNGFEFSEFYTDKPCLVQNCKDPACVFGHTCKSSIHRKLGAVLVGSCFFLYLEVVIVQHHHVCTRKMKR